MSEVTRPRSVAEMRDRLARVIDPAKVEVGLSLALRASDIVITPYGKSGTTWTQQIVHTLRTRGDMDFDDISRVVPWIEASPSLGLDLSAEQKASPRAFKSHLDADTVPKGGRYINVVRHPGDALLSMYKFMEGWLFEPGTIPLEAFATGDFLESRKYYVHLRSWWARRQDADVLFLAYEKMLLDPERTIRRIAAFCDIELDDELLAITLDHSSLTFMSRHKDRFDDAMIRQRSETVGGLPAGSDSSKVREGKSSSGAGLPASVQDALSRAWHEEITETLGYASYDALLENLDA